MFSIIADALMVASRTKTCGGWSDCRDNHQQKPQNARQVRDRDTANTRKWMDRAGER